MKASLRRNLEQARHCVTEALSVVVNNEDPNYAWNDIEQALRLLEVCRGEIYKRINMRKVPR